MRNEPLFIICQSIPIGNIWTQIDFFRGPKGCQGFFVKLPDLLVLDWKEHKSVRIVLQ
jgi:hypothetical protein